MNPAPIALFVYNRPLHTQTVLRHLARNGRARDSLLYIFSDGARDNRDATRVAQVRSLVRRLDGFRRIELIERERNFGLAGSIVDGVSRLCREHGRVIVLEDDVLVSPWFLDYMNSALDVYRDAERVMHVSGYMFPVRSPERLSETFFYRATSCWGWATWARAWARFEAGAEALLRRLQEQNLAHEFDILGSTGYTQMLLEQARGRVDSWAICWYASVFLSGGLCLHPRRSLTRNIGHDGSGVHRDTTRVFEVEPTTTPVERFTDQIEECMEAVRAMAEYYRAIRAPLGRRILRRALRAWQGNRVRGRRWIS